MDYSIFIHTPLSLLPILALIVLTISVWFTRSPKVLGMLIGVYILTTLIGHRMTIASWVFMAVLLGAYALFYYSKHWGIKCIGLIGFVLSSAVVLLNHTPGVQNWEIVSHHLLSPDSIPWSLFLNYDAPLIGLWVLVLSVQLINSKAEWKRVIKKIIPITILVILFMIPASHLFGYVHFAPKRTNIFFIWGLSNLLFTCLTEEALFRVFIQKNLIQWLSGIRYGQYIGIVIASACFGLAHFAGGPVYIVLAGIAGLFYGYAYYSTGRIEASILTHFLLNATHFLLFSYPALAGSI